MPINHINLARLDLNLLVAFDALLTERSVTRAAARTGVRQSAMSHTLSRLRVLFHDELLTRAADGMHPTPRALSLIDPVRVALSQIEHLVAVGGAFEPRTDDRTFRLALSDSMEVLLGPALLDHLRLAAPHSRLRLHALDSEHLLAGLDADAFDLAIGFGDFPGGRTHHRRRTLFTETYLCMFEAARTGIVPPISLADYVRLPHVLTSLRPGERGVVDDALARIGQQRSVILTTPRFLAVPFLVRGAPVVTTMHARLARFYADALGLTLSPPPVELPQVPVSLVWHESYERDAAQIWLRETVAALARG